MISFKEETKGHGEVVWGNKFSTIAGSTTSVTVGAKSSFEISASNTVRFGVKNTFEYGPSFTYHCGPEFTKAGSYAPNTDTSFGKAENKGKKLNWANAKITFSDIKEHKFSIAKEGSTSMFVTNKLYSETGFTAGAGYGLLATTGYKAYSSTVTTCRNVMTAMTVLPVLVSLLQNLFFGPGSKDSKPQHTLNSYAGMAINIGATLAPALVGLVAAVNAVAAREGFKNAIKPLSVLDMNKSVGVFMGSDHSQLSPVGLANGLKMSEQGISLGISQSKIAGAFDKDGDLKFGKLKSDPAGMLAIGHLRGALPTSATAYVVNQAPVFAVIASGGGGSHKSAEETLKLVKAEKGDIFLIGQQCMVTAPTITLADIDPSQSDTSITLKGGHNNAAKSIVLQTKKNHLIQVTDDQIALQTGKKTAAGLSEDLFAMTIKNKDKMTFGGGKFEVKTSNGNKLLISSAGINLNGSNLKVMK